MCAKVDDFWQVSAAKVWQINFAMRDRLESEHVFFPRSLRFFNLVYPPFFPPLFLSSFFCPCAPTSTNVFLQPRLWTYYSGLLYYSVSISEQSWQRRFWKLSSWQKAFVPFECSLKIRQWVFFAPSCGVTNSSVARGRRCKRFASLFFFFWRREFIESRWPPFRYDTPFCCRLFSAFFRFI